MKNTYKTAKVIKEYPVKVAGWDLVVPVGATVCNQTACGFDNNYRFWLDFREQAEKLTGYKSSILAHDLTHYGVNVPAEYCEPYAS